MEKIKVFTIENYLISKLKYPWLRKEIKGLAEEQAEYHYGKVHQKHDKTFKIILEDSEELEENLKEVVSKSDKNKEIVERKIKITMLPTFGEEKTNESIKKII